MNRDLVVLILNAEALMFPRAPVLQSKGRSGYHFKILDSSPSLDMAMFAKCIQLIILPDKGQTKYTCST